ncbi:MAG: hypothetical protein JO182_06225, partial [Acidobacteriaceae bacterium]|nr:hypothetical protein [Acidobacteriaceae bacterium]
MQFTKLNDVTIQQAYVTMEGYVGDNPTIGFKGMLHLYSLWLAQSKAFFRPADSTDMQNLYDYWDAALTQARPRGWAGGGRPLPVHRKMLSHSRISWLAPKSN